MKNTVDPEIFRELFNKKYKNSEITDEMIGELFSDEFWNFTFNRDKYEHIEQAGGGEGGTEDCYGIIKFKDKYYKTEWRYFSHYGFDYCGAMSYIKEVTPKQKTITVYE